MSAKNNFVERSLLGVLSFLKDAVFAEEYASRRGFLQSLDPRIKAVTFFLFVILVLISKNILVLTALYAACLLLALASGIRLVFFLKRTWLFIPLFSLFIGVPALFSIFTPGEPLVSLQGLGLKLIITRQGLNGALLFVARVTTSVSYAVLLSLSTRHFALLKVLRIFRIPQVFVMTIGICYRYIYLFIEIIENTYLAIKSRVGTRLHYRKGQSIVAWNIAGLWSRSYELNEEVYKAMLSRGYRGEPAVLNDFKAGLKDWLWLFAAAAVFTFVCFINIRLKN
ncbi:MAG: cobalt ECF transporter T component CbiQ [Candidatus Omnitrophica bacterium]|nr:cobalt ECF transporter T component CbiQ [Candidatus Omnitrophota bacterium]